MYINLKTCLLLVCFYHFAFMANAQVGHFTIKVKMTKSMDGYKAFLYYFKGADAAPSLDSVDYEDGGFEIRGQTAAPQKAFLYIEKGNTGFKPGFTKKAIVLYLEKGNIHISSTDAIQLYDKEVLKEATLGGTPLNDDYQKYLNILDFFKPRLDSLRDLFRKAYQEKDSATLNKLNPQFKQLAEETQKAEDDYFDQHLNSLVALDWLKQNLNIAQSKSKAVAMFNKLSQAVKNSPGGRAYKKMLAATHSVETGDTAPDFMAKNIHGDNVSLSSFRGKYLLLDFWASWCGPCRKENPNVLKAYNSFKAKNFMVLSFSMDESQKAWENAVTKDALPWPQLSDLKAWGGIGGQLYGISGIPSNFLIDPQGKIIARDLRGEALETELSKILK